MVYFPSECECVVFQVKTTKELLEDIQSRGSKPPASPGSPDVMLIEDSEYTSLKFCSCKISFKCYALNAISLGSFKNEFCAFKVSAIKP